MTEKPEALSSWEVEKKKDDYIDNAPKSTKTKKGIGAGALLWLLILIALIAGASLLLNILQATGAVGSSSGGSKIIVLPGLRHDSMATIIVNGEELERIRAELRMLERLIAEKPEDSLTPSDSTHPAIEALEIVPGRIEATAWTAGGGKNLYTYSAPTDLAYSWNARIENGEPAFYWTKLPLLAPSPAARPLLWVRLHAGASYRELDLGDEPTFRFAPAAGVGLVYSPWPWLELTPISFGYPPAISAKVGFNIPIARRKE